MNRTLVLREMRLRGWSQNELSRRIGVSPATMSLFMRGLREPRMSTFKALCEALDIKPEEVW